jgi:hypothetical protein
LITSAKFNFPTTSRIPSSFKVIFHLGS